ncbi:MAG: UTP--glucose-1-phosphate uridylyltransferase [Oscillospiraceae bacterium]|nr:MAG: UTP--glucose-1-phosphate uridylyltransferase [Oscillospiraceae bacterium]
MSTNKITKAVIPAAGLGTRMLPIARTVCKETLPIVDRPAISYLVNEAIDSGATDILIITNRGKGAMEDYFDYSPEYEAALRAKGKDALVEELRRDAERANIYFIRQKEPRGLGHAVLAARNFIGNEPFYVLYGDDVIMSKTPVCAQLRDAYEKYGKAACGVKEVTAEQILKYSSLDAKPIEGSGNCYNVTDMIEKPKPEEVITRLSILGRVLLTPDIFDILAETKPGAGGEIQLTDAMRVLAQSVGMTAVDFEGKRYDLGSKLGFLYANVESALRDPELGGEFREYLKELAATL